METGGRFGRKILVMIALLTTGMDGGLDAEATDCALAITDWEEYCCVEKVDEWSGTVKCTLTGDARQENIDEELETVWDVGDPFSNEGTRESADETVLYLDLGLESGTTTGEYTADVTFKGYYTPSGDLVCEASNQVEVAVVDIEMTRPDDKANSQYFHYVYDENADPNGVCEVTFMVQITPDTENVRDILKDEINCSIDSIAESSLSWKNNGDTNTGILEYILLNKWNEKAIFTTLPSDNAEFGLKNVAVSLRSKTMDGKTKVFFSRDAKNHPGPDSGTTPNWFYYWEQGAVNEGMDDFIYGGDLGPTTRGAYNPTNDTLKLYAGAPNSKPAITVTHQDDPDLQFEIGRDAEGIAAVAGTCIHEKHHQWIHKNWVDVIPRPPDKDEDGVPDSEEGKPPYRFDKNKADTYDLHNHDAIPDDNNYDEYGDQEFLCRMKEKEEFGPDSTDESKDWAKPGKQWDPTTDY